MLLLWWLTDWSVGGSTAGYCRRTNMIPHTLDGELLRRKCRRDYGAYVALANPGFVMTHFHRYLCNEIQAFLERPTTHAMDILLLSVPPQHGKSFTVTETLPSWYLGRYPQNSCIIAGYESTFAEGFNKRNREKFKEYACDVFPDAAPNDQVQGAATWETSDGGRCRAAGLKAGITGYPADLFIIDDPIKNLQAAESESVISTIHAEMNPSVQTRIHPGGKLIVIQTRWVENDVIGWVLRHWGDYVYKYINLPCECEDPANDPLGRKLGEALVGEHMADPPLPQAIRNDNKWLVSKKALVLAGDGLRTWNALYQGHPSALDGNLFKASWWQLYNRASVDAGGFKYLQLSVDATFKKTDTSDLVAITLWGLQNNDAWLYKLVNKRMGFIDTVAYIRRIVKEFPDIDEMLIEDKANGSAIIETLQVDDSMPPIVAVNPKGGKYSRAQAISSFVAAGRVHVPGDFTREELTDIEWDGDQTLNGTQRYIEQFTKFPFMAHDDMVDSSTQALTRLIKLITGEEPLPEKRYIRYTEWHEDEWEDFYQMSEQEQSDFIRRRGAPIEWAPDDYFVAHVS